MNVLWIPLLSTLMSIADALTCKACIYMDGKSDNNMMKAMLDAMASASQKECRGSASGVMELDCSTQPLPEGHDSFKCGKATVGATMSVGGSGITASLTIVTRGCAPVKTGDPRAESRCAPAEEYRDLIENNMQSGAGQTELSDLDGLYCLCEGDNCNSAPSFTTSYTVSVVALACLFMVVFTQ